MAYKIVVSFIKHSVRTMKISYLVAAICLLLCVLLSRVGYAQKDDARAEEEITVTLEVKGLGVEEAPALIRDKEIFLSVNNLFDFLKVKYVPSTAFDSVNGFYINEQDVYVIDKANNRIVFKNKIFPLQPDDLLVVDGVYYLDLKYFKTVFGLDGVFNFRRLWVSITSNTELPAIREARLELMRKNVSRLKGELKADTTIKREYPVFHLGAADWAVYSTQQSLAASDTRATLGLGGMIAGGEANASLSYYSGQQFTEKQQFYQWRFVNNDNPVVRQVVAGKIFTQSISSLYAPLVGVQVNNTPTIQRHGYGTYTMSNTTEPGWIVELYINEVLIDYKKADASGFYTFDVPLIYGYSVVKLRFYGPYGEEPTSQQYISIPFNFLPAHEFEYSATGGIVEDGLNSKYSRVSGNYGLSNHITVGGGMEYLSSITSSPEIPFLKASARLTTNFLVSGEYAYNVRSRGIISYRMPSNVQFDIDYTKYAKGQTAIFYNYLEEKRASVTVPIRMPGASVFSRIAIDQITLPTSKYTNAELAFSGSVHRVGLNLTSYASVSSASDAFVYSIFSVSFMLPKKIFFTSQAQYNYKQTRVDFMKVTLERNFIGKSFLNLSYQEYFASNNRNLLIGFRYDLSFARINLSALQGNKNTYSRVESASGSFLIDGKTNYINANNRSNVGRGGIVVRPFLDLNCNGIWDKGEPKAPGLKLRINGGRTSYDTRDTTVRIFDLEPYNNYYIELDRNSFDYVSWQIKNKTIKVTITPNNFTEVQVAVSVYGEASGTVTLIDKNGKKPKGQGRIVVNIYNDKSELVAHTLTESDGFFNYLGLAPGAYTAQLDSVQLHKLHMTATPLSIPLNVRFMKEGDYVDNLDFKLNSDIADNSKQKAPETNGAKEK
ncbi:MAG: Sporulation Domain-Containing Protein [Flavipsychrobacter sp.]|nr:Sporulation Domain-Containing Protein [Flavipsychrobacter sp.]